MAKKRAVKKPAAKAGVVKKQTVTVETFTQGEITLPGDRGKLLWSGSGKVKYRRRDYGYTYSDETQCPAGGMVYVAPCGTTKSFTSADVKAMKSAIDDIQKPTKTTKK